MVCSDWSSEVDTETGKFTVEFNNYPRSRSRIVRTIDIHCTLHVHGLGIIILLQFPLSARTSLGVARCQYEHTISMTYITKECLGL